MTLNSTKWEAFFDELEKIATQELMHKEAKAYIKKVATALGPSLAGPMQSPFKPTQTPMKIPGLKPPKVATTGMAGISLKGPTISKGPSLGKIGMAKVAKDDSWDRESDSFLAKHKKKVIGGLALATAAGVGAKLLHTRWKAKNLAPKAPTPVEPPSVKFDPIQVDLKKSAPPPPAQKPQPKPQQKPKPAPPKPAKVSPADVQADLDPRKQHRRGKFERRRRKDLDPIDDYIDDEEWQ